MLRGHHGKEFYKVASIIRPSQEPTLYYLLVNFFLAFKSQFVPKCKRWHHDIGTKWGKTTKKAKKVTT
jgi:hypothetical protein